jgi:hypothetical protein
MKTNKQNKTNKVAEQAVRNEKTAPELQSRSEQSRNSDSATAKTPEQNQTGTVNASVKPYVNFAEREYNRKLPVEKVLEALKRWMPLQYELAEVVGKWVWITFPEPPIERVRAELSQLGFHWNNTRKCWQHPCGDALPRGQQEPREKYNVWFPFVLDPNRVKRTQPAAESAA